MTNSKLTADQIKAIKLLARTCSVQQLRALSEAFTAQASVNLANLCRDSDKHDTAAAVRDAALAHIGL